MNLGSIKEDFPEEVPSWALKGASRALMGGKADWVLRAEEEGLGGEGKPSGGSSRGAGPGDGDDEARKGQISRVRRPR